MDGHDVGTVRGLARTLVETPSHEDETAVGDVIADWLHEHTDGQVSHEEWGVVARGGDGNAAADRVALVGHHDVVPPDDPQTDEAGEYVVSERDGRLYGRGSADMKGSLAAAMCAFRDAAAPCTFVSFRGEERGGVGARQAIDEGFAPEYAVVGEGSTGYSASGVTDVAVAHKGRRGSTVTARGASAHASEPEAGENAVYRATDAVNVVRELDAPSAEVLGQSLSGSVVVTEIEGGSAWNVVPDACEVTVDERTVPGERADIAEVEGVDGVSWSIDQDLPPMHCRDDAFAEVVLDATRDVQDGEDAAASDARERSEDASPALVTKPHATDAGWLDDRAGTACVVCGPAEPGEAHTERESASVAVLARCRRIYEAVASTPFE